MSISAPQTRAHALASQIEQQIMDREFESGDLIGTIDDLKSRTGFARSTVAEAIRLLTDRGLAEIRPGRGGGLFAASASPVVRLRHTLLSVVDMSAPVSEAIEVREALEPLIVVDAARHRTPRDIEDIRSHLDDLRDTTGRTMREFVPANWRFHERLAAITPNKTASALYLSMLAFVRDQATEVRYDQSASESAWLRARFEVHADLADAVIAGDVDGARLAAERHSTLHGSD